MLNLNVLSMQQLIQISHVVQEVRTFSLHDDVWSARCWSARCSEKPRPTKKVVVHVSGKTMLTCILFDQIIQYGQDL